MLCANCQHRVDIHALNGCREKARGGSGCPCPFSYDPATKHFNSECRPVDPCLNGHLKGCGHVAQPFIEHLRATAAQINENLAAASQVGGDHYRQTKIQPWDIIDDWSLDFYRGNALKYLLRAGRKGPALQDLEKARHYIEKCIEREQASGKE